MTLAASGAEGWRRNGRIELVGFLPPCLKHLVEMAAEGTAAGAVPQGQRGRRLVAQAQTNHSTLARIDRALVMDGHLRTRFVRVDDAVLAVDDVIVDAVLDEGTAIGHPEDALRVGLVLREQQGRFALTIEEALSQPRIDDLDDVAPRHGRNLLQGRPIRSSVPGPLVAEPERRQNVQFRGFRAAIANGDLNEQVLGGRLGILHEDIEVTIFVKDAGVDQFVLELVTAPAAVGLDEVGVGEGGLGILVEVLHVRVRRRTIEIEVVLLDVFAVIAFGVGQAEEALFQNGIGAVPEGQGEAESLLVVGDAGQPVLAPAIGAGAGLVVGEVVPGVAVLAVIFADGPPLSFAEVRPPLFPGGFLLARCVEPVVFRGHGSLAFR